MLLEHPYSLIGPEQHRLGQRQEDFPTGGEPDLTVFPVEQLGAELALELLHLVAEGRLRHVQQFGGPAETQRVRDIDEVLELEQFH